MSRSTCRLSSSPARTGARGPAGSIVTVENLFFNVPARLKFLKATATEAGHIHRIVSQYALAYPQVRFILQNDNRSTFQTSGNGELFDALAALFGLETARQMISVENTSYQPLTVSGYVGTPSLHRGARDQIIFFVNKRWIQDRALNQAVVQAFHTFLPVGRYPVAVLNISIPPENVDVNVHPTKAEVKFSEPGQVFKIVQKSVREAVVEAAPVPGIGYHHSPAQGIDGHAGSVANWSTAQRSGGASGGFNQFGFEVQRTLPAGNTEHEDNSWLPGDTHRKLPPLRVVGQLQQMYIITEGPDGLYLIDQHAAHERVLYEKLAAQKETAAVPRQQLLEPAVVELSPGHAAIVEAEFDLLTAVGFDIEPFGGTTFRIRAVPEILGQSEPGQTLVDILAEMSDGAVPLAKETHEKIAITVCKRASVKGGQLLSPEEMRELVRQLEQTTAPRTCPHGRPTMIHLSAAQLAREFGRL